MQFKDIEDIINRIQERIDQNSGSLIDVRFEFHFSDGSLDRISGFEQFDSYRSLSNSLCTSFTCDMSYAVPFSGNDPERQNISLILNAPDNYENNKSAELKIIVEYSNFSWGHDVINLFRNFCEEKVEKKSYYEKFISFLTGEWIIILPLITLVILLIVLFGMINREYIHLASYLAGTDPDALERLRSGSYQSRVLAYLEFQTFLADQIRRESLRGEVPPFSWLFYGMFVSFLPVAFRPLLKNRAMWTRISTISISEASEFAQKKIRSRKYSLIFSIAFFLVLPIATSWIAGHIPNFSWLWS